jgi:hypothetical protein
MTDKTTTVADLIDILKQFSQDLPVLVAGYEGESTSVVGAYITQAVLDEKQPWYYGEWREGGADIEGSIDVVFIGGLRHG